MRVVNSGISILSLLFQADRLAAMLLFLEGMKGVTSLLTAEWRRILETLADKTGSMCPAVDEGCPDQFLLGRFVAFHD
jgi:hypothetical protein